MCTDKLRWWNKDVALMWKSILFAMHTFHILPKLWHNNHNLKPRITKDIATYIRHMHYGYVVDFFLSYTFIIVFISWWQGMYFLIPRQCMLSSPKRHTVGCLVTLSKVLPPLISTNDVWSNLPTETVCCEYVISKSTATNRCTWLNKAGT